MKVMYRISDHSYNKGKLPGATKDVCLQNFLLCFSMAEIELLVDKVDKPKTEKAISTAAELPNVTICKLDKCDSGNAQSLRFAIKAAVDCWDDEEIIYLVEDDYLHDISRNVEAAILEPFERGAHYVTLYDHPDKYQSEYGMAEIGAGEVFRTPTSHWKWTISTTMTFATKVRTLKEDMKVWMKYTKGDHPNDHQCFKELWKKPLFPSESNSLPTGSKLACPIPGMSCHTDLTYSEYKGQDYTDEWAVKYLEQKAYWVIYDEAPELLPNIKSLDSGIKKLAIMTSFVDMINQRKNADT